MKHVSLTLLAHRLLAERMRTDDLAIDATVGNGRDTLFLARQLGPDGQVIGFDVQPSALAIAGDLLRAEHFNANTRLIRAGHENMRQYIPLEWHGQVSVVMFNLGYLPGGDRTIRTQADTTLRALDQAQTLLRSGGVLSVLVYRGHAGSGEEDTAVNQWLEALPDAFVRDTHESPGPVLHLIERRC